MAWGKKDCGSLCDCKWEDNMANGYIMYDPAKNGSWKKSFGNHWQEIIWVSAKYGKCQENKKNNNKIYWSAQRNVGKWQGIMASGRKC